MIRSSVMNSDTSHSEDAALRRLLRELGTIEPPADFDVQLRARLKGRQPRRVASHSFFGEAFAPRFTAVACGVFILLFGVQTARNPGTHDLASSGANDLRFVAESTNIAERLAQVSIISTRERDANRGTAARRITPSSTRARNFPAIAKSYARINRNSLYPTSDNVEMNTEIATAAIPVYMQSVSVMPRDPKRESETLMLNSVSFGGEPLASVAANGSATRRSAVMTPADMRERDTETQSAW